MAWIFLWILWTGESGISRHPSLEICQFVREEWLLEQLTHPDLPVGGLVHASRCEREEDA